jgi:hypothetical protein
MFLEVSKIVKDLFCYIYTVLSDILHSEDLLKY